MQVDWGRILNRVQYFTQSAERQVDLINGLITSHHNDEAHEFFNSRYAFEYIAVHHNTDKHISACHYYTDETKVDPSLSNSSRSELSNF